MQDHQLALKPGYVLEHFRLERVLGKGGFGITYAAVDVKLGRRVAIKELLPDSIATRVDGSTVSPQRTSMRDDWQWAKDRFIEEAKVLAGFSHPAIVGVHLLIEANGTVYMVMDYIEGESYEARLRRIGTEPDEESLMAVIGPVLEGLEEVHAKGLLHRDIKPENLLIKRNGQPVLIDFGAARESVGQTVTMTSMVTHGYSPIEQYQSKGRMGPWTDIYAVGALMCRAMTGEKPPVAANRVMDEEFEWLSYRELPGFSEEFRQTVDWALRVKPQERPQSVADFLPELGGRVWADDRFASPEYPKRNPPTGEVINKEDSRAAEDSFPSPEEADAVRLKEDSAPAASASGPVAKQGIKPLAAVCLVLLVLASYAAFLYQTGLFGKSSASSPLPVESDSEGDASKLAAEVDDLRHDVSQQLTKPFFESWPQPSGQPGQTIHVPKDYATISAALAAAKEGQTVLVAPGVYEERIMMKSGVRLEGEKWDTTIIRNRSAPLHVVTANGISSATLSNFTIEQLLEQTGDNRYSGVTIENSTITVQNCQVRSSGHGIAITGSGNSVVSNCWISDCAWNGIIVYANAGQPELRGNNCFGNKQNGIDVWNGGRAKVVGNTCNGNQWSGISVTDSGQADLSDNTCSENKNWGIWFVNGSKGKVEGNICNGNTSGGLAFRGSSTQVDIVRNFANGNGGFGIAVETVCIPRSFESNQASGNQWEPQINRSATWND